MFLLALGGSLLIGAGVLAVAAFSEGALLAMRTAAQVIGWLLIAAGLAGAAVLRRRELGGSMALFVSVGSGLLLLYISLFDWSDLRGVPSALAAAEALAPVPAPAPALIDNPSPALAAALGMKEIVIPPPLPKAEARSDAPGELKLKEAPLLAKVAPLAVAALQRDRCADKTGLAYVVCQERARLEYCESRSYDETCPSPIPAAYPG